MSLKKVNKETYIRGKILRWYQKNGRELPWRKKVEKKLPNSYYIFVSEFMLQQTTVNSVIPKFNEFIKIWPTIKKLSNSKKSKILKFWSGLGYYARARNLLESSKLISKNYNNLIPKDYKYLIKLPGVGDYTAKAIQGIAFNMPVLPIDTNIKRIILRVNGITREANKIESRINLFAKKLISLKNSSNFIQALMDYGSIVCLPNAPRCAKCIISNRCVAFKKNLINKIITKKNRKKLKPTKYTRAYLIVNEFNEIVVRQRPAKGMLQLMMEVPNDIWVNDKKNLKRDNLIKSLSLKLIKLKEKVFYSFSHLNLEAEIYYIKVKKIKFKDLQWLSLNEIKNSGLPTVMKKFVKVYKDLI